jgi:hypothetical protein
MSADMKHISAIIIFLLAIMLQLWFAPAGMRGDFVLAALIVFAFLFEFWELSVFVLLGFFILNLSFYSVVAAIFFMGLPFAIYFFRKRFPMNLWLGSAVGIAGSIVVFYVVTAPFAAFQNAGFILIDILVCIVFGELVLCGMEG